MISVLNLAISLALGMILLVALLNAASYPRLRPAQLKSAPLVSLLVPARNEAGIIEACVAGLLAQDYPHFEVLVLDDKSEDGTGALAQAAGGGDGRLRVLAGQTLPTGWVGKNWACWQLAQTARGELLVFTDADVRWAPGALAAVVATMERQRAEVFTVWPTQETHTWAERLVVPLVNFAGLGYLPELGVRWLPFDSLAAANGQLIAFERQTYQRLGGHAAVRQSVVEDVALARLAKQRGALLVLALGEGLLRTRMYTGWESVRTGFAKNILAGHGNSLFLLGLSTVFHWALFVWPWLWLLLGAWLPLAGWPWLPGAWAAAGIAARAVTAGTSGLRVRDAWGLPLAVLLMTAIATQSAWWQVRYGGPLWKGRRITGAR